MQTRYSVLVLYLSLYLSVLAVATAQAAETTAPDTTHPDTSPEAFPETTPPETTPPYTSPEAFPETTPPETTPPDTSPEAFPETTPPETTPPDTSPEAFPETTSPETTSPETTPPDTSPEAFPETTPPDTSPEAFPETTRLPSPQTTEQVPETTPEPSADTTPYSFPESTSADTIPAESTSTPSPTISTTRAPTSFYPLSCMACPAGFFLSQESLNCTACPPGSSTHDFSNASSALDCICSPGFNNETEACQLCQEGFYKQSLENASCASCPANSHTAAPGASVVADCVCKPGFTLSILSNASLANESYANASLANESYANASLANESLSNASLANESISNASPHNGSMPAGLNDCVPCDAGTFKTLLGNEACAPCTADNFCPPGSSEPRACPLNSSSLPGSSSVEDCVCADGLVLLQSNDTYKCEECHADTYYARDPETSLGICLACQPGAGSPAGSRSERDCVCKPGFFVEPYTNTYTCSACAPGTYSAAANVSVCDACAPGTFAGSTAAVQCTACASGSVALAAGMSACVPCPASTWQNVELPGHLSAPCAPCPENAGHELTGVYDVRQCVCAPGLYKEDDETQGPQGFTCSSCEPGFKCEKDSSSAVLEVTLVINVAVSDFTPVLQQAFKESVAHTSGVDPERVRIISVTEFVRRLLLRRLLSGSINVEFEITYPNINNVSAITVPTLEQFKADAEERALPPVEQLAESQIIIYEQRTPCQPGFFCVGGEQVFSCRIFSSSCLGALSEADCACVQGFYSLNTTSPCNKCPPGSYCPGGLVVKSCARNSTSAPGAGSADGCYCRDGHWHGCTRTHSGAFINNTGLPCSINFTAPCVQCRANDICFNDTLLHCPDHSTSQAGSSQRSHCVCDGGFAVEYF
jgi:hypothetical protein